MAIKAENLPELVRKRKGTAVFWCVQGDAAARVGAKAKLGDGGGAQVQRCRKEEEEAKETKGEKRIALGPIYKANR